MATTPAANGSLAAISMQAPRGVFTCQRTDGKPFELTEETSFAQLYIDGTRVEQMPYNEREGKQDVVVTFATHAASVGLSLASGEHTAHCTLVRNGDGPATSGYHGRAWGRCETDTDASMRCTSSGVLRFSVRDSR